MKMLRSPLPVLAIGFDWAKPDLSAAEYYLEQV